MTPEALARMLVATYGIERRDEIKQAIEREYPLEEADALIDGAVEELRARDAEHAQVIGEAAARARDAEHDLDTTMHDQEV